MYHAIKKYICIFASVLLFLSAGCSGSGPGIDISEKKYETEISSVELQIPQFKNFQNSEFQEELNNEYNAAVNKWLEDFSAECEKNSSGAEKWNFRLP